MSWSSMRLTAAACFALALFLGAIAPARAQSSDTRVQELINQSYQAYGRGDPAAAVEKAREALRLTIQASGEESLAVAEMEIHLVTVGFDELDDEVRLAHLQHVLATRRKLLAKDSILIAEVLGQLASDWTYTSNQPERAIPFINERMAIYQANQAVDSDGFESALVMLGQAYWSSNQRQLAVEAYQRLIGLAERRHGGRSREVASALWSLATLKDQLQEFEESRALYARQAEISKDLEAPPLWPLYEADTRAFPLMLEHRYQEAEQILRRALASEAAAGPDQMGSVSRAKLLLVEVLCATGRCAEGEPLLLEELKASVAKPSFSRIDYIRVLLAALKFYEAQGRYQDGDRIVAMIDRVYARTGLVPAAFETGKLIDYFVKQARFMEALSWSSRAIKPLRDMQSVALHAEGEGWLEEQRAAKALMFRHLSIMKAGWDGFQTRPELVLEESFQVGQLARGSNVGQSIARMAVRKAQLGDAFATALRDVQDGHASLATGQAELSRLMSLPEADRGGVSIEARLAEIDRQRVELQERERALAARYPQYQSLVSQVPMSLAEVSSLLRPDEALLVIAVDIGGSYAWLVRHDRAFFGPSTAGQGFYEDRVRELRAKLTSGETGWAPVAMVPGDGIPIYNAILVSFAMSGVLSGANHVFVVADGALQSLPFGVLPDGNGPKPDWLARRYAFSYLPSVASLRAVRKAGIEDEGTAPFIGFGDPVLGDLQTASTLSPRSIFGGAGHAARGGLADVSVLRSAPALPETEDELRAVATALGAPESAVFVGQQATEARVKTMDLGAYRVISFATHGVMAGELTEDSEPGLVLTPPAQATALDDGYLGAGEVAALRLNAEWVLLSACNTAAPNGTPGAEGFSGLANAFLYAGARALLVSHWRVESAATTELVSLTISKFAADPKASKAMALQRAMLVLMARPAYAHPYYWAAFSVVGD